MTVEDLHHESGDQLKEETVTFHVIGTKEEIDEWVSSSTQPYEPLVTIVDREVTDT